MKASDFKVARFHVVDGNVEQCSFGNCPLGVHEFGLYIRTPFSGGVLVDKWVSDHRTWDEAIDEIDNILQAMEITAQDSTALRTPTDSDRKGGK